MFLGCGVDADLVSEVWTVYKEVQAYYEAGLKPPSDVTIMFADDNWGNIRRLPAAEDGDRSGGFGVSRRRSRSH